jgi:simple sugar transport system ATP-binding protein
MPASPAPTGAPAIGCVGVEKRFGHVDALRGATISVSKGRITVLFGDNGAGKSTLLRILCGIHSRIEARYCSTVGRRV